MAADVPVQFPFGTRVIGLGQGEFSDEVAFSDSVPVEVSDTYLRIIALWHDNEPLGGELATIEIRSGQGNLTALNVRPVGAESEVTVIGTNGALAGKATCGVNNDIYLVHISELGDDNGPWRLRLKNNDSQTLYFVAVSSTDADQTFQPWMVWGATKGTIGTAENPDDFRFSLQSKSDTHAVAVRNLGTGPLVFFDSAGPIGGHDSPAVISAIPHQIEPHGIQDVVFGVHPNGADADATVEHTMTTSDPRHTAELTIFVSRTNFPPPPPPPPGASCNVDQCPGYVPPPPYPNEGGPCVQPGCGHDNIFHGLGGHCSQADCPGFLDSLGRNFPADGDGFDDDAVCAQPTCGHPYSFHHTSPHPVPDSACQHNDGCRAYLGPGHICRREICRHPIEDHGRPSRFPGSVGP